VSPSRLGVSGALSPPLRQGDPFLRFTLDAEGELCPGRRREVEVATGLPIAVDKMSPGSMPRRSTRSCRTACCSRRPLALREAGVEAHHSDRPLQPYEFMSSMSLFPVPSVHVFTLVIVTVFPHAVGVGGNS